MLSLKVTLKREPVPLSLFHVLTGDFSITRARIDHLRDRRRGDCVSSRHPCTSKVRQTHSWE